MRDGIVVDKNYMNLLPQESKTAIPKNKNQLVLYLSLLRVPKEPTRVATKNSNTGSIQTQESKKGVHLTLPLVLH